MKIYKGDALEQLKKIETESIDCIVTSPPYWQLRDYGVEGQLGLEKSLDEFLEKLTNIFQEAYRVLKETGTLFVNLGDTYSNSAAIPVCGRKGFFKGEEYEAFKRAEYLTEGVYDNKKQLSKFYIDKEGLLLYVVGKDGNIVTLYDIDFGMSRIRNKNILVEILGEILEKEKEQQEFERKKNEELKELERRRKTIEMEKEELREKLGLLESDQGLINKQIENTRNQGKVLDMHIKNTYRKIIKSIEF
ncbi:MAG: site-specific DNA-methyltransferase [Fusobacteriales bacterium]|jgi:DNA modification methylase|nr:site-specific DNA-methyltransferase [Fusobacteriales bacterium]